MFPSCGTGPWASAVVHIGPACSCGLCTRVRQGQLAMAVGREGRASCRFTRGWVDPYNAICADSSGKRRHGATRDPQCVATHAPLLTQVLAVAGEPDLSKGRKGGAPSVWIGGTLASPAEYATKPCWVAGAHTAMGHGSGGGVSVRAG